jgi:hypothetical protein
VKVPPRLASARETHDLPIGIFTPEFFNSQAFGTFVAKSSAELLMLHSTRSGRLCVIVVAAIGLCGVLGCGNEDRILSTQPVTGKVTLDGKPLAGAEIWLVPTDANEKVKNAKMTIRPYAKSQADGTFTLTSYVSNDGAPLGEYGVMVQKVGGTSAAAEGDAEVDPETPRQTKTGKASNAPDPLSKYRNPTVSGLTFTVKEGPNQLNLELKSK